MSLRFLISEIILSPCPALQWYLRAKKETQSTQRCSQAWLDIELGIICHRTITFELWYCIRGALQRCELLRHMTLKNYTQVLWPWGENWRLHCKINCIKETRSVTHWTPAKHMEGLTQGLWNSGWRATGSVALSPVLIWCSYKLY